MRLFSFIKKRITRRKRNIFLLILLGVIFFEIGLLIVEVGKDRGLNVAPIRFKVSDIPTNTEIFLSSLRYSIEQSLSKDKKVSFFEAAEDEKRLRYLLAAIGPTKSMEMLIEEAGGGSILDCHQQAHQIGRVAYRIYRAKAFTEVNYDCHSGYLHGAIEEFLNKNGTEDIAGKIDELCKDFENEFFTFECLHGSGHGMMAVNNYDIKAAIEDCKKLNTPYAQSSCFGGVFMENVIASQGLGATGHTTKWVSDDPHFPCTEFLKDKEVLFQCYQMQTSRMLDLYAYNFQEVAEECLKSEGDMVSTCFRSFGRDVAGNTLRNPYAIVEKCNLLQDTEYYPTCLDGALYVILDFWGPNLQHQATELCNLIDSQEYKPICYSAIIGRARVLQFDTLRQEEICSRFDSRYQYVCNT